jgi:hypothetical protein
MRTGHHFKHVAELLDLALADAAGAAGAKVASQTRTLCVPLACVNKDVPNTKKGRKEKESYNTLNKPVKQHRL